MRLGECGHASEQIGIEQAVSSENKKQGRIESPTLVRVNLRSCLGTVLETRKRGYNISKIITFKLGIEFLRIEFTVYIPVDFLFACLIFLFEILTDNSSVWWSVCP